MGSMTNEDATLAAAATEARAWDLVAEIGDLLTAAPALQLRLARHAAWFKRRDLLALGYTSWAAFARARLDLNDSWSRDLVRLAESDLPLVKAAVSAGALPLRDAVKAPGVAEGRESAWLLAVYERQLLGPSNPPRPAPAPVRELDPSEQRLLAAARDRVRLLRGVPLGDHAADRQLLDWYWSRETSETLLAAARQVPAPPDHQPLPPWPGRDLADELVGPWVEPESLAQGLELLEGLVRRLDTLELDTGRAWREFVATGLGAALGETTLAGVAGRFWGASLRTLQRRQRLANDVDRYPELARAVGAGELTVKQARVLVEFVDEESVGDWIEIARRVPCAELREAATHAGALREAYVAAIEQAGDGAGVSLTASMRPAPPSGAVEATEELLAAARWLLETVEMPRHPIKDRDGWCCQNPECRRRSLRLEAHHIVFRSEGGGDEPENLVTLCRACHLRGVHTGVIRLTWEEDRLVWDYPGRRIIQFTAPASSPSTSPSS